MKPGRGFLTLAGFLVLLSLVTGQGCPATTPAPGGNAGNDGSVDTDGSGPAGCWIGTGRLVGQYLRIRQADGGYVGDQSQGACGSGYFTDNIQFTPTEDPNRYSGTWATYNAFTCGEVARPQIVATFTDGGQTMTIEITEFPYNLIGVSQFTPVDCSELP